MIDEANGLRLVEGALPNQGDARVLRQEANRFSKESCSIPQIGPESDINLYRTASAKLDAHSGEGNLKRRVRFGNP
ncbi:hypothetical protein D3C76_1654990 [compost metagenome]